MNHQNSSKGLGGAALRPPDFLEGAVREQNAAWRPSVQPGEHQVNACNRPLIATSATRLPAKDTWINWPTLTPGPLPDRDHAASLTAVAGLRPVLAPRADA